MFGLGPATRIYVALGATDMRKGYDGLYGPVRDKLGLEVRTGHLFLFANARRNRLKILYWDGTGLWSCAKRDHPLGCRPTLVDFDPALLGIERSTGARGKRCTKLRTNRWISIINQVAK